MRNDQKRKRKKKYSENKGTKIVFNQNDEKLSIFVDVIYNNFQLFNQSDSQVTLILITWNQWK